MAKLSISPVYDQKRQQSKERSLTEKFKYRTDIVKEVSLITRIDPKDVDMIFRLIFKNIKDTLIGGKNVRINDFATFKIWKKKEAVFYTGHRKGAKENPDERFKPGTAIIVPKKYLIKATADESVRKKVNEAARKRKQVPIPISEKSQYGATVKVLMKNQLKKEVWNAGIDRGELPPAYRVLASDRSVRLPNDVEKFV